MFNFLSQNLNIFRDSTVFSPNLIMSKNYCGKKNGVNSIDNSSVFRANIVLVTFYAHRLKTNHCHCESLPDFQFLFQISQFKTVQNNL